MNSEQRTIRWQPMSHYDASVHAAGQGDHLEALVQVLQGILLVIDSEVGAYR